MTESNWEYFYEEYNREKKDFAVPREDAVVVSRMFSKLENSVESPPSQLNALVIGVAGQKAIKETCENFWENISIDNENDNLFILDVRNFDNKDRREINLIGNDRTFLIQGNGCKLPFEDTSFNLVLTHCLFPCLNDEDLRLLIKEIDRVTVRRGLGIHTFRSCSDIEKFYSNSLRGLKRKKYGIKYYDRSEKEMEGILNSNNFQIMNKGAVGDGFIDSKNLTVGCEKRVLREKKRFKKMLFIVEF